MLIAKSPSRGSSAERKTGWRACRPAMMAVLVGLAACNPIDTWRDWTGASQNDPDPGTTPNKQNLAAGEAGDYPNLATVPPPPVRAMTAAEREKLTQSLIADRANARYSDEQLRAGFSAAAAPLPPPPGAASASEPEDAQSGVIAAAPASAPTPTPAPTPAASPTALVASASPPGPSTSSTSGDVASDKPAAQSASGGPRSAPGGGKAPARPKASLRKQGEPPEPGPMESSLDVPQPRATPQPEPIEPAPPPPQLPPPPQVSSLPGGLAAGGALAPTPLPQAKAAAGFEPAPAAPELPPAAPTRSAAAEPGKAAQKAPAPVGTPVAEIKFTADSASLTESDRHKLEAVVPLYQKDPGRVRIVGYAGGGGAAVEQLNGYRTALDRARAVSAALTQAGIPADKIQVEAAPAGATSGESRAEVILEH